MPGQSIPVSLGVNQAFSINCPFTAQAIGVDNPTPFYVHFPQNGGFGAWVPPFTQGAIVPAPGGHPPSLTVSSADVPPWSSAALTTSSPLFASILVLEDYAAPSSGTPVLSTPEILQIPYTANATVTTTVTLPGETIGISILSTTAINSLVIKGHTSGYVAINTAAATSVIETASWFVTPDVQADVTIITGGGQTGTLYIRAESLPIKFSASIDQIGGSPYGIALQLPNKVATPFNNGGGANQTVVAASGSSTIRLFGILFSIGTAGAAGTTITLLDGATPILLIIADIKGPQFMDFHGAPLTPGNALLITIPAGAALYGSVSYSQA